MPLRASRTVTAATAAVSVPRIPNRAMSRPESRIIGTSAAAPAIVAIACSVSAIGCSSSGAYAGQAVPPPSGASCSANTSLAILKAETPAGTPQ